MLFILYGRWTKDWAKITAFLSQPDILCLGEESFALAKTGVFNLRVLSSPWRTKNFMYAECSFFTTTRGLLRSCKPLRRGKGCLGLEEPEANVVRSSTLQQRSFLFVLANCLAVAKVSLRLGEVVPLDVSSAFLTFCHFLCLIYFQYMQNSHK